MQLIDDLYPSSCVGVVTDILAHLRFKRIVYFAIGACARVYGISVVCSCYYAGYSGAKMSTAQHTSTEEHWCSIPYAKSGATNNIVALTHQNNSYAPGDKIHWGGTLVNNVPLGPENSVRETLFNVRGDILRGRHSTLWQRPYGAIVTGQSDIFGYTSGRNDDCKHFASAIM